MYENELFFSKEQNIKISESKNAHVQHMPQFGGKRVKFSTWNRIDTNQTT